MTSSSTPKKKRHFPGAVSKVIAALVIAVLLIVLAWVVYAALGMRAASRTSGSLSVRGITAEVRIVRDARDVPHITAASDRDLFYAQGYAEGSDRLFQMDLLRRYVYGRLAEVLGPAVLPADEHARIVPLAQIVAAQWNALAPRDRELVQAFSDGVNAAMRREPLPVEFHLLLYKPQPWTPQDSLAVGMATALDLIDSWDDVIRRDAVANAHTAAPLLNLYSVTDPAYDAPVDGDRIATVKPLAARSANTAANILLPSVPEHPPIGSNEWAVGAVHSSTGRALLANDPHLRLGIPGIWYLVDLRSPDMHVAGGSLAGTPGVILGHNDAVAWGATNGTVTTEVLYRDSLANASVRRERFHVRFGKDAIVTYYSTAHGFAAATSGDIAYSVSWHAASHPQSPLQAFIGLDRADSLADAVKALRAYPGPPQNFVLADTSGNVAYQLAGLIPEDPSWGMRVHPGTDPQYRYLRFDELPHVAASRSAEVFTANNRMYGAGYPYRLTSNFAPPYRAHRIQHLLESKPRLAVADLAKFQTDTLSLPERDIARATVAAAKRKGRLHDKRLQPYLQVLAAWDGRFDPGSRGAAIAWNLRQIAVASLAAYNAGQSAQAYQSSADGADLVLLMRVLRERPRGWWPGSDYDDLLLHSLATAIEKYGSTLLEPWGRYGAFTVKHPLSMMGFSFLDGARFQGDGDSYGIHVQTPTHSQSFRAVWDVGNWDAGGMVIPSGESGEPGSGHYTDLSPAWIAQKLVPLPFSDAAVRAAARQTLVLTPQ
jgi:penicillin amidase